MGMRRAGAWALSLALMAGLSGCGGGVSTSDAVTYVDGLLRETYFGEGSEAYMALVDTDEAGVQEIYDNNISVETENFLSYFGIEYPTDDMREEIGTLYREIYSHAKFEVVSAAQQSDGSFSVKVSVEPIDTVQLALDQWDEAMAPFYDQYGEADFSAMSEEEYVAADREYGAMVIALMESVLDETGNLAAESITVQLEQDSDGYYAITDEDFVRLDARIIAYDDAGLDSAEA